MDPLHGNGEPQSPQGQGAPEALNEEKVALIAAQVVNQAFTARSKTLKKELSEEFTRGFESITKRFDEFAAATPPKSGGKKDGGDPSEESPAFKSMQRKLVELEASSAALKQERDQERANARDIKLRQRIGDELNKHGITDAMRARHATTLLVDGEKRVRFADDSDDIVFRDLDNTDLDLATGLKSWVKSEDAKIYLPPTGARGSGDRPGQGQRPQHGQTEMGATDIGLAIANAFGGMQIG